MEKIIIGHPEKNTNADFCLHEKEIITTLENSKNLLVTLKDANVAKAYLKRMEKGEYR